MVMDGVAVDSLVVQLGLAFAVLCGGGCGSDSTSTDDGGATGDGADTSPADSTSSGADTIGDGDSGGSESGIEPPSGPGIPEPGSCGWDGANYGCGWMLQGQPCGAGVAPGQPCGDIVACCTEDAQWVTCFFEQASDGVLQSSDCASGSGAGTCGWNAELSEYTCGGDGADPGGIPQLCPDTVRNNADCQLDDLAACCDSEGDAWRCTEGGNGGKPFWRRTECEFE